MKAMLGEKNFPEGLRAGHSQRGNLVGAIGLEPTTPTMSRWCSNQLSYAPEFVFEPAIVAARDSVIPGQARDPRPWIADQVRNNRSA